MAKRVTGADFEEEVLHADGVVLVDFYSDSCVPCKRMSPLLAEIEETYPEGFRLVKVNINFDGELAQQYEVQAAPTLIFFRNGAEAERLVGAVKKSEITAIIDALK
jgi:thioredoxin 1